MAGGNERRGGLMSGWRAEIGEEQRTVTDSDTLDLLYAQGCSDETIQSHQSPTYAHTLTHTHATRNLHTQYESELVVAVACVTGCDIILSHCNAPGFDSEEQQ